MRIPFDGLVCRAVACELRAAVGARAQKVVALDGNAVSIQLFDRRPTWLTLSWDPEFFRLHLAPRSPVRAEVTPFVTTLRGALEGGTLLAVEQHDLERVVTVVWGTAEGEFRLIAELMGRHSHLVLTDSSGKLLGASHWVGAKESKRPLLPGQKYAPPPGGGRTMREALRTAESADDLEGALGASPFLLKLVRAGLALDTIRAALERDVFEPVLCPGVGVYPLPIEALGLEQTHIERIGEVLDLVMHDREHLALRDRLRRELTTQFERAILAREVAVTELTEVQDTAARAAELQLRGELILAYMGSIRPGDAELAAWDYEGNPITVPLHPERTPKENAQKFFDKAKRAKGAAQGVNSQLERINAELNELGGMLAQIPVMEEAELLAMKAAAMDRGFYRVQRLPTADKSERPYAGHRVKEIRGPMGYTILLGENSEANDYLTLRVAKPSDIWLHVRGSPGAHVVIQVPKKGAEVPPEVLREAAMVAARNSPQKHSSYVAVDWTQKRYVRRIKGGGLGVVQYDHERTLHVEPTLKD